MKNGPIFEWIPGNIIMDKQDDEEYFNKLPNDMQYHHKENDNIDYVPEESDDYEDSIGSWEAKYSTMDEER